MKLSLIPVSDATEIVIRDIKVKADTSESSVMSTIGKSAEQADAQAHAKAQPLKTYRLSFSDARFYYYDV